MSPNATILDSITTKINSAKLSSETKEVFSLLLSYFDHVLSEKNSVAEELKERVSLLENKVEKLEASMDNTSQYDRRDTLIISGDSIPISSPEENCKKVVIDLFLAKLHLNIDQRDISVTHRVGRKMNNAPDKRNIILKLCRRDLIPEIFNACRQFRPEKFFISESLTPTRNKICYVIRQLKKKFPGKIRGCRTHNGEPRVILADAPAPLTRSSAASARQKPRHVTINTKLELEKFVCDYLKTTLNEVVTVNW